MEWSKKEKLDNFQVLLAEQTDVDPSHQILLLQSNFLSHSVDSSMPGTSFPDTAISDPIILCSKDNNNISLGIEKEVPAFPALPNLVSVENDATLAKSACAVGYAYRRKIEAYSRCAEVMNKAVKMLVEVIGMQLEKLLEVATKCKSLTKIAEGQMTFFQSSHASQTRILDLFHSSRSGEASSSALSPWKKQVDDLVKDDANRFKGLKRQLDDLFVPINHLNKRYVTEHQLSREWNEVTREISNISPCAVKAKTFVAKLKESWQHLLRDRASRTLTYNDEQFHILEKIKMQETIRVLVDLLQKECQPVVNQLTEVLADWFKMSQTTFLQTEILHKDIAKYEDEIETFAVSVKTSQEKYETLLEEVLDKVKEEEKQEQEKRVHAIDDSGVDNAPKVNGEAATSAENGNPPGNSANKVQIRRALRSILSTQDEVWGIMNENSRLIEQFGQLAAVAAAAATSPSSSAGSIELNSAQILAEVDDTLGRYGQ